MINFSFVFLLLLLAFPKLSFGEIQTSFYSKGELQESALEGQYGEEDSYSSMHKAYANTGVKINIDKRRTLELNWLLRYTNSELYHENTTPLFWANYPNSTIARNMFKLRKIDKDKYSLTESTLNQFSYTWQDEESSVTLGRMFIKYGEGFTFNPINPFNYPTHFSSLKNIDQGNDGLKISLDMRENLAFSLFLLGNQDLEQADEEITRTIFLQIDHDYAPKTHLHYIIGEDQKRHILGLEYKYSFEDGLFFAQAVSRTTRLDRRDESENLFDSILGFEKDLSHYLVTRVEIGRQDIDKKAGGEGWPRKSFLPIENFISLINQLRFSDNSALQINYSLESSARFQYLYAEHQFKFSKSLESRLFYGKTLRFDHDVNGGEIQAQMPMEMGVGLGFKF